MIARLLNGAWSRLNGRRWQQLRRALRDPEAAQRRILRRYLETQAETDFGRRHRFDSIDGIDRYQRRVPLSTYDDYLPAIERIRRGETGVLTRDPVRLLLPSSGSTAARKLIPFTAALQTEINAAVGAWIVDLFRARPNLMNGPAYWSISPALPDPDPIESAVPVGFDDDSAYLGGVARHLVERVLAVPGAVRRLRHTDAFRYVTLLHLLRARELRLVSVWHPSFLTLLLEPLAEHWERLVEDVERGGIRPPEPFDRGIVEPLALALRPRPRRARALRRAGPHALDVVWPRLGLISCWADGHTTNALPAVQESFPGVPLQPKGLIATEAMVTVPFAEARPLAVNSHFFEFLDDTGRTRAAHELRVGADYSVVVTTGGGLYRYRLRDRVRVDGRLERTPTLRFLGKEDRISDRFGEKLSDAHVAHVLRRVLRPLEAEVAFAMLAPDERREGLGYTLYLESSCDPPGRLAERLDDELRENPYYQHCQSLGQLAPARVFRVARSAHHTYVEICRRGGIRTGDVKPVALSSRSEWTRHFHGSYLDGP